MANTKPPAKKKVDKNTTTSKPPVDNTHEVKPSKVDKVTEKYKHLLGDMEEGDLLLHSECAVFSDEGKLVGHLNVTIPFSTLLLEDGIPEAEESFRTSFKNMVYKPIMRKVKSLVHTKNMEYQEALMPPKPKQLTDDAVPNNIAPFSVTKSDIEGTPHESPPDMYDSDDSEEVIM